MRDEWFYGGGVGVVTWQRFWPTTFFILFYMICGFFDLFTSWFRISGFWPPPSFFYQFFHEPLQFWMWIFITREVWSFFDPEKLFFCRRYENKKTKMISITSSFLKNEYRLQFSWHVNKLIYKTKLKINSKWTEYLTQKPFYDLTWISFAEHWNFFTICNNDFKLL